VFWNFAVTFVDGLRCETGTGGVDWAVEGLAHMEDLANRGEGCIILTAHMGNYDIAAPMFASHFRRTLAQGVLLALILLHSPRIAHEHGTDSSRLAFPAFAKQARAQPRLALRLLHHRIAEHPARRGRDLRHRGNAHRHISLRPHKPPAEHPAPAKAPTSKRIVKRKRTHATAS
jgi:hypothetical protein